MSYQRAVVNCRACYALAGNRANDKIFPNVCEESLRNDSSIHSARNEALRALEEEISRDRSFKDCPRVKLAESALTACMNCNYKEARIAEIFDPSDGSV